MTLPELRLAGWHAAKDSWVPGPAPATPRHRRPRARPKKERALDAVESSGLVAECGQPGSVDRVQSEDWTHLDQMVYEVGE